MNKYSIFLLFAQGIQYTRIRNTKLNSCASYVSWYGCQYCTVFMSLFTEHEQRPLQYNLQPNSIRGRSIINQMVSHESTLGKFSVLEWNLDRKRVCLVWNKWHSDMNRWEVWVSKILIWASLESSWAVETLSAS